MMDKLIIATVDNVSGSSIISEAEVMSHIFQSPAKIEKNPSMAMLLSTPLLRMQMIENMIKAIPNTIAKMHKINVGKC